MQKLFWILVVLDLVLASSGVKERKRNRISEVLNVPDSLDTEESPNMSSGPVPIASSSSSTVSLNSLPGTEPMTLSDALVEIDFDDLLAEVDTVVPVETAELTDFIIPENLEFPCDFFGPIPSEAHAWDLDIEAKWTLKDREYLQYRATIANTFAANILNNIDVDLFRGQFAFDYVWPGLTRLSNPTRLSTGFHAFALRNIFMEEQKQPFELLCRSGLIDFSRPIYEHARAVYHSFLSFALENVNVPVENLYALIKYFPKQMLNWPSSELIAPLDIAIRRNRLDLVEKLVEAGADMNKSIFGTHLTPFMLAIQLKNHEIVGYFVSTGKVDPNVILHNGTNAIHLFSQHLILRIDEYLPALIGNLSVSSFEKIIFGLYNVKNTFYNLVICITIKENFSQLAPAIFNLVRAATECGDLDFLIFLDSFSLSLKDLTFESGLKLLHIAACCGHSGICSFLIQKGSSVNSLTAGNFTPVQLAYLNKRYDVVKNLIASGATVGLANVLQEIITHNQTDIFHSLIIHSASLGLYDLPNGYNLVTWSISQDRPEILRLIHLSKKLDFRIPDPNGRTIFNFDPPENCSSSLDIIVYLIKKSNESVESTEGVETIDSMRS